MRDGWTALDFVRATALVAMLCPLVLPLGCRGTGPANPSRPLTIPSASSDAAKAPVAPAVESGRCTIVAMQLQVKSPGAAPFTVLTLSADGKVAVSSPGGEPLAATLDPAGCLVGPDGLWAELTPSDALWTTHETLHAEGASIALPEGALRIRADGAVERVHANGTVDGGTLQLVGYRETGRCAGLLLLATFLSMMPSMAVADGHPAMAPAPTDSTCAGYRRAGQGE